MRAIALTTAFATLAFAAPVLASTRFDGSWNMVLTTTSGHCGIIDIGVVVADGHISATSGRFVAHKIFLNGQIWGSGKTKINGVAGPRRAIGTGTFTPAKGSGKWNGAGPSGVCSGIWVADRLTHRV